MILGIVILLRGELANKDELFQVFFFVLLSWLLVVLVKVILKLLQALNFVLHIISSLGWTQGVSVSGEREGVGIDSSPLHDRYVELGVLHDVDRLVG